MEFNNWSAPLEVFLSWYSYVCLRPLVKLWLDENGRELFTWDDFVKKLLKAKIKDKIQNNRDLNLHYPCNKQPPKLIKETRDKHPEMA